MRDRKVVAEVPSVNAPGWDESDIRKWTCQCFEELDATDRFSREELQHADAVRERELDLGRCGDTWKNRHIPRDTVVNYVRVGSGRNDKLRPSVDGSISVVPREDGARSEQQFRMTFCDSVYRVSRHFGPERNLGAWQPSCEQAFCQRDRIIQLCERDYWNDSDCAESIIDCRFHDKRESTILLIELEMVGCRVCTSMTNNKTAQTVAYFIAFAALGMAMASLGPTLPGLAQQTRSTVSDISFLFTVRSFGFLLGSLFSGRFYDRLPGHSVMAGTIVVVSAAMATMPLVDQLPLLLTVMLVLGTAEGALGVGGNALLVWVHGRSVAPFMNALHFSYGVGGFIAPLIIARTLANNAVRMPYFVLAILILPAAILLLRLASPTNTTVEPTDQATDGKSNHWLVFLIALLLCLYIGAEVSWGSWIYSYVLKVNIGNESMAAYLTSLFWGSLTIGRLLGVPIGARFRPRAILLTDIVGCFVSVGIAIIWPTSITAITVATVCAGLSMASIYPTALTFAERRMKITGQITGFLIVGGSVGGMIVPLVIGQMFESIGPRVMMLTILVDLLLLLVVYVVLVSRHVVPSGRMVASEDSA